MSARGVLARLALAALALAALGLLARALLRAQAPPEGPVPVAFDHEACARCGMLISDPRFAAQLQTRDGRVLDFDDPGGLLLFVHEQGPEAHAIYFHHVEEERWIPREAVGFVPVGHTPMSYGLGAVDADVPGALDWDQALDHVLEREESRRARPAPSPGPGAAAASEAPSAGASP